MTVEVTKQHIKEGWKRSSDFCPVAKAVRAVHLGHYMYVLSNKIIIDKNSLFPQHVPLPWKARLFIWLFDRGLPVIPIRFEL